MERKERVIDLRNYFKYLFQNARIVILVALICAAGLSVYDYSKQNNEISGNKSGLLNEIMSQNHDAYYGTNEIDNYTDAECPEGAYNSAARLYIDFNYSDVEGSNNLDFTEMNNAFEQDAKLIMWSTESLDAVIDKLDLHSYEEMKNLTAEELKWMINQNFFGAHIMNVVVTDSDPERAQQIADAVIQQFVPKIKSEMKVDSVEVIDPPTQPVGSGTQSFNMRKIAKYGAAGFAGGIILIALLYLIIFLVKDAMWSWMDVEFAGLRLLGDLHRKKGRQQQERRLAYVLRSAGNGEKIVIAGADKQAGDTAGLVESLNSVSSEGSQLITCIHAGNLKDFSEAIELAQDDMSVLIVGGYGKTSEKDLIEAADSLKLANIKCAGVVIQ